MISLNRMSLLAIAFGSIVSLNATAAFAQSQPQMWQRYIGNSEQCRKKHDMAKAVYYVDAAISEFEKMAQQKPKVVFTQPQQQQAQVLVNYMGELQVEDVANSLQGEMSKIISAKGPAVNAKSQANSYKTWSQRYQRVEAAFLKLFGPNSPATVTARNARIAQH